MESYAGLSIDVTLAILTGLYLGKLLVADFLIRRQSNFDLSGGWVCKRSLLGQHISDRSAAVYRAAF